LILLSLASSYYQVLFLQLNDGRKKFASMQECKNIF